MALDLCKYYKKQRFVSYDNGQTWQPLDEYERGELYEAHSASCGAGVFQYRWVLINNGYICDGKDRYTREIYQYSEDGTVWYNVFPTMYRKGTLVESNSPFCDNAGNGQYIDDGTDPSSGTTCPPDYHWDGHECVCDGELVGGKCIVCKGGSVLSGSECICTGGTFWNGSQCEKPHTGHGGGQNPNHHHTGYEPGKPHVWNGYGGDPYKAIKCENSKGILTSADTAYYTSGWSILTYEIGDCIYRIDDNAFNGQINMYYLSIPSSVVEVGDYVFSNCENLPTISFPTSALTELGEGTFNNCSILSAVTFGGTIPSVLSANLFANCINLQSATWLQNNNITAIGEKVFYNCYSLNNITLPESLQTIREKAFYSNYALENITIPSGVTSIGANAFENCTAMTFVNINSDEVSIGDNAFKGNTSLTAVTIDSSGLTIGNNVFSGCTRLLKLTFTATVPPEIEEGDFDNTNECAIFVPCQSEQAYKTAWYQYADRIRCNDTGVYYRWVDDPSGVYCDGTNQYTRQKQQSTTNGITWTDTGVYKPVTFITHYSEECGYQGEVALTVTNSDGFTRYYESCDGPELQYRTVSGTPFCSGETRHDKYVEVYSQESADDGETWVTTATTTVLVETESQDCVLYRWVNSGTTCVSGDLWAQSIKQESINGGLTWKNVIPETYTATTLIENNSLDCSKLVYTLSDSSIHNLECNSSTTLSKDDRTVYQNSITAIIGNCVTSIGGSAFAGCGSLTSCTIGSGVTSIGTSAFTYCTSLTNIDIPDNVTYLGNYSFGRCYSLTSCTIGSGVTSIGSWAFNYCSGLTNVYIPDNVTTIGEYAFYVCSGLTNVRISNNVTSIGDFAFALCTSLINVDIPNSVTILYQGAFDGCTSLTSVTIGSGVTTINHHAFSECFNLTRIDIPNSVTNIDYQAFYKCSGLTSVIIGSGITIIGQSAFEGCSGLTSITVNAITPPVLRTNSAFSNTNDCPIYVPAESVETYKTTSGWYTYASRIQAIP